jgi:hypothetical protein
MFRDAFLVSLSRVLVVSAFLSACSGVTSVVTSEPGKLAHPPAHPQGFWEDQDHSGSLLGFEDRRMLVAEGGHLEVARILDVSDHQIRLCRSGREQVWPLRREGPLLVLEDPERGEVRRLRQLPEQPSELKLAPLELPAPMVLPAEKVREVQKELAGRLEGDQEFRRPIPKKKTFKESPPVPPWLEERSEADRKSGSDSVEMLVAARSTQNTEYIINLVNRIGWVDANRFDYGTSNAAFLLVQHSWNLPLMLGVLPWIEKDAQEGRVGKELYALLFDRVQLSLGERQRYGTQVLRDGAEVVVLPVEDPARVDELRQEAGMIPLERYVKLFGGGAVRFSTDCRD